MALIPADIGLRLRQQTELLPQPVTPLREIPADLPELKTGQVFTARIQEVLPENTYRALVAGKSVTLALPESVKSGDLLELVVVDRTPKSIIAQLAAQSGAAATAAATATPYATFSRAAQMISTLLSGEGEAPAAAPLNRGAPLLAQAPARGAELVPVLRQAVTESGLFYEAHQALWVAGKLPLASLLQEPQGQLSAPQAQLAAQVEKLLASMPPQAQPVPAAQGEVSAGKPALVTPLPGQQPAAQGLPVSLPQIVAYLDGETATPERLKDLALHLQAGGTLPAPGSPELNISAASREPNAETARSQTASHTTLPQPAAAMPEELRPLVQQQLDAAGTQRLFWHGEVWPGQTMQWQVEWNGERNQDNNQSEPEPWLTTLRLTTPRLGEVEASLRLGAGGVHIALNTPYDASAADLRRGAPDLEQALAAAGVPLLGLTIKHTQEE